MKEPLLLTPGPTNVPARVREVTALPMIHHRTKDFQQVIERVNADLKKVFCTQSPVLFFASSGTGAMEASITNFFSQGDVVISASAGKWGERFRDIAKAFGLDVKSIELPYGQAVTAAQIEAALKANPAAKGVLVTLCETSTAVTHPIKDIAAITRQSNALLIVDAISGLGCDPLKTDEWGVDVVVCGSQKGLMLPPGLSFVSLNDRAQKAMASSKLPKYYWDFKPALKAMAKNDTAFTPAVSLVRGLGEALAIMLEEGIENVWKRHAEVADFVRREITADGLELFSKAPAAGLTAIVMPSSVPSGDVIKAMRDAEDIWMADGQGELQGKLVRFAHMGAAANMEAAKKGLAVFRQSMAKAGYRPAVKAGR